MGQIITPKECPLDKSTPEICCNIPEINDHAPKPLQILTQLKKVIITQEEAEKLILNFEQQSQIIHDTSAGIQIFPTFTPVTESIVTVTPCTIGKRSFGNQGTYTITTDCEEEIVKNPSISREFLIFNNKKSSVEIKRTDTHHIHIEDSHHHSDIKTDTVFEHSAGNKGLLDVSSDLFTTPTTIHEDSIEELSQFGHTYGTPQPVLIEYSTEMYMPENLEHLESKYGEFFCVFLIV
jgi:hypothetical protein